MTLLLPLEMEGKLKFWKELNTHENVQIFDF